MCVLDAALLIADKRSSQRDSRQESGLLLLAYAHAFTAVCALLMPQEIAIQSGLPLAYELAAAHET